MKVIHHKIKGSRISSLHIKPHFIWNGNATNLYAYGYMDNSQLQIVIPLELLEKCLWEYELEIVRKRTLYHAVKITKGGEKE